VFFLKPLRLDAWHTRAAHLGVGASLRFDVPAAYPGASCILLLVYAYAPFSARERLSAYYLASQRGYLASQALVKALCASGIPCEIAAVPARALALANGVGVAGKNGLLRIGALGSRFALYTLATSACMPRPQPHPVPLNAMRVCAPAQWARSRQKGLMRRTACVILWMVRNIRFPFIRRRARTWAAKSARPCARKMRSLQNASPEKRSRRHLPCRVLSQEMRRRHVHSLAGI
jgi:hypothetical protein